MNHWQNSTSSGWDMWLCYSSQMREGKVINLNLSRASGPCLLLCWWKSVMKWVLVPIMGSGSGDRQNLANISHHLKIWSRPTQGVLQDVVLRGNLMIRPGVLLFSLSALTSCADRRPQPTGQHLGWAFVHGTALDGTDWRKDVNAVGPNRPLLLFGFHSLNVCMCKSCVNK